MSKGPWTVEKRLGPVLIRIKEYRIQFRIIRRRLKHHSDQIQDLRNNHTDHVNREHCLKAMIMNLEERVKALEREQYT